MADHNDLRAAREHGALLKDLAALCAKYTACPAAEPEQLSPAQTVRAAVAVHAARLWPLPDDPFDITEWFGNGVPDDPDAAGIVYIAGPMSGQPEHGYPAFNAMAARLRAAGHTVINPAELHPDTTHPWAWYLRRDLAELVKCSTIVFLPGWFNSKGARLEHHVASALDLKLVYPHDTDEYIADRYRCIGCGAIDRPGCPIGECSR